VKGSRPTRTYALCKAQKIHVFGALGFDGVMTKPSPKINAKKFLPFVRRLSKHNKKLCIIVDNARWHLTKAIKAYLKEKDIKMIRLLTYSPELNPIEQYWKNIKQSLATKLIETKEDLIREVQYALKKDIFIPKISQY